MYSRLYRQVLNRYYWAESCESFTSFHTETGLFGISGSCNGDKSLDLTSVLAEHFMKLAIDLVEDEEFDRAVNMLKCNVLTQLESRLVLFEDVGRQILTYGKREGTKEMCDKIDAVTKEDLRRIVRKALGVDENFGGKRNAPTLSAVGDNLEKCPSQEEVARWFQ
jgi:processing peptidase subunit alpha